ncbi:unnamed protein product [Tilletia controversa]|nr:unnamed protein product [Tilletia controversa]
MADTLPPSFQYDHPFLYTRHAIPVQNIQSAPASPQSKYPSLPRIPAPSVPPVSAAEHSPSKTPIYPTRSLLRVGSKDKLRFYDEVADISFQEFRAEYERAFEASDPRARLDQLFDALLTYVLAEFKQYEIHKTQLQFNWRQQQSLRLNIRQGHNTHQVFKFLVGYWNLLYGRFKIAHEIHRQTAAASDCLRRSVRTLSADIVSLSAEHEKQTARADRLQERLDTSNLECQAQRLEIEELRRRLETENAQTESNPHLQQQVVALKFESQGRQVQVDDLELRLSIKEAVEDQHLARIIELERQVARSRRINRRILDDVEIADYTALQQLVAEQGISIAELSSRHSSQVGIIRLLRARLESAGDTSVPDQTPDQLVGAAQTEARLLSQQLSESRARERVFSRLAEEDDELDLEHTLTEGQPIPEENSDCSVSVAVDLGNSSPPATSPPVFVPTYCEPPVVAPSPSILPIEMPSTPKRRRSSGRPKPAESAPEERCPYPRDSGLRRIGPPPSLLVDAQQNNHHRSFREPLGVGGSGAGSGVGEGVGEEGGDMGSDVAASHLRLDQSALRQEAGIDLDDGRNHDCGEVDAARPQTASAIGVGDRPPEHLGRGLEGGVGLDDDGINGNTTAVTGVLQGDRDVGRHVEVGFSAEDELHVVDAPESTVPVQETRAVDRCPSFLELSGEAELNGGSDGAVGEHPHSSSPDDNLDEDVGGDQDLVDPLEEGFVYGVVAAVHTAPMGPLTESETRSRVRLLERIRLEEAAAVRLAPTLVPLGKDHLAALLPPLDPYKFVPSSGSPPPAPVDRSKSATATLDLLAAWQRTGGTVENYIAFGIVLARHAETEIKSLYIARRLVEEASGLVSIAIDMCPASCVAFTGPRQDLLCCPLCGLARYRVAGSGSQHTRVAVKTYNYVPYLPRLKAYFENKEWSKVMRYWSQRAASTSKAFGREGGVITACDPAHRFGDLCDGMSQLRHREAGRFLDSHDVTVAISTDGAQLLSNRRASSAWLVLVQTLNLPPSLRFAVEHQHVSLIVPGPGAPKDLDSFLWPLYAELASLAVRGAMVWDGAEADWVRIRVHLLGVFGDQPASAKLPLNRSRPEYVAEDLPERTITQYRLAVARVMTSNALDRRRAVGTSTGISQLPPVSFAPSFDPMEFFPLDPFHLFNFNVPKTIWKAFVAPHPGEFGLSEEQRTQFGAFISSNAKAYPTSFSSRAPRDISLFSNTSYKMVEWGSVFHHFLPAFLHYVDAPSEVRCMLDYLLQGVDMSMDRQGVTLAQIQDIRSMFARFVQDWERLYVGTDAAVTCATISVHLLLHVSDQMARLGSIRATSQATCERMIGVLKKGVTAFRSPYSVMANRALSKAQVTLSRIRSGDLGVPGDDRPPTPLLTVPVHSAHEMLCPAHQESEEQLLRSAFPSQTATWRHYGRLAFGDDIVVRSARVETADNRCCANVKVTIDGGLAYFHVLHFTLVTTATTRTVFALAQRFVPTTTCPKFDVGSWSASVELIPATAIRGVVAALSLGSSVYVVQRSSWQQDPLFGSDFDDED